MGRTLTIIARDPDHTNASTSEGDPAIQAVCDLFTNNDPAVTGHFVEHAATVSRIRTHLEKYELTSNDLLQIIGHGIAGKLLLGQQWNKLETNGKVAYVLDSNPKFHGALMGYVPRGGRVWLIGCGVGSELEVGTKRIADGPTLLFDLARMWDCEVAAPTDLVTAPDDFDANRIFKFESRLVKASQQRLQAAEVVHAPGFEPVPTNAVARVKFTGLYGLPIIQHLGFVPPLQPNPRPLGFEQLQELGELLVREVDASRVLAGAELLVNVSIDGRPEAKGEVIANLRVIRAQTQAGVRYFELTPAHQQLVKLALNEIIDQLRRRQA